MKTKLAVAVAFGFTLGICFSATYGHMTSDIGFVFEKMLVAGIKEDHGDTCNSDGKFKNLVCQPSFGMLSINKMNDIGGYSSGLWTSILLQSIATPDKHSDFETPNDVVSIKNTFAGEKAKGVRLCKEEGGRVNIICQPSSGILSVNKLPDGSLTATIVLMSQDMYTLFGDMLF